MIPSYLRRVILRPYLPGRGPAFTLTLWETGERDRNGKERLRYRLTKSGAPGKPASEVFDGDDFYASPLHALDSDATVRAVLGFLTLKPGDTDADAAQAAFARDHAEALDSEARHRFGED